MNKVIVGRKGKDMWYPKYAPHICMETGKSILDDIYKKQHMTKKSIEVVYPQLEDIRLACQVIANGIEDVTPMLSEKETKEFICLASKWMFNLRKYKKDTMDDIIDSI